MPGAPVRLAAAVGVCVPPLRQSRHLGFQHLAAFRPRHVRGRRFRRPGPHLKRWTAQNVGTLAPGALGSGPGVGGSIRPAPTIHDSNQVGEKALKGPFPLYGPSPCEVVSFLVVDTIRLLAENGTYPNVNIVSLGIPFARELVIPGIPCASAFAGVDRVFLGAPRPVRRWTCPSSLARRLYRHSL